MQKNNLAIILSGGKGKRFDSLKPKQFFKIDNVTILERSVNKFIKSQLFNKVLIVSHKSLINKTKDLFKNKKLIIIEGGLTRQKSVLNGLEAAKKFNPKFIFIHDSVRPFFSLNLLKLIFKNLKTNESVIPALDVNDSVRDLQLGKYRDIPRDYLKLIQTPQGFCFKSIYKAHKNTQKSIHTDDSMILYELKNKIKIIDGERFNFKITKKEDLELGNLLFKGINNMNEIRVGTGFDVHKFKKGKSLKLFGVKVPYNKSLEGHSDADVGFHAIVDALLGALGLGDIGNHFPPTEKKWKNKSSIFFMKYAKKILTNEKYKINNLDITLICEQPKVSKYQSLFTKSVANALLIDLKKVNIKGTTTEKLGFLGREEGIACQVAVIISKND